MELQPDIWDTALGGEWGLSLEHQVSIHLTGERSG